MSRVDVIAYTAMVALLGVVMFVLGGYSAVPGWLLWAGVCGASDMIATRIVTYRNGVQEYTAYTIAAVGSLMYLPTDQALYALSVGSVLAVALSRRIAWYKRAFNTFAYLFSSLAMWSVYQWVDLALGGVPWPSLAATVAAFLGVVAFELTQGTLFALLEIGMGMSLRDIARGWWGTIVYPAASVLVALGLGSLYELGYAWFALPLVAVLVLLRPEYDLRGWLRGKDRAGASA